MASNLFGLPLRMSQTSYSTNHGLQKRKRKRAEVRKENDTKDSANDTETSILKVQAGQSVEYSAVVTPEERLQRRVAGLEINNEPPIYPFPYKTQDRPSPNRQPVDHADDIKATKSLRLQHLAVMMGVLHKCMLRKDFHKANRALSVLIREEMGGHEFDIRLQNVWGIGAEVLLGKSDMQHDVARTRDMKKESGMFFTQPGWEETKQYLEALMVRYPYNKSFPNSVNSLNFSIVLYSLWVYIVHQGGRSVNRDNSVDDSGSYSPTPLSSYDVRITELQKARDIAADMDARMDRLPYQDDAEHVRLREQISLWIADLQRQTTEEEEEQHLSDEVDYDAQYRAQVEAQADDDA